MNFWKYSFAISVLLTLSVDELQAAEFGPQNHRGNDLILQDGDVIWGLHYNVGRFEIPEGTQVNVAPYDGETAGSRGRLEVRADDIIISGFLNAMGVGYSGGSGGGGGGGAIAYPYGGNSGKGGSGGSAAYQKDILFGIAGGDGSYYTGGYFPPTFYAYPGFPGEGGYGDGNFGGRPYSSGDSIEDSDGGYYGLAINRDLSEDKSTSMGSGAAGNRGGGFNTNETVYSAGYAGGCGGGEIRLLSFDFFLSSTGRIRADGALGNPSSSWSSHSFDGRNGGHVLPIDLDGFANGIEDIYEPDALMDSGITYYPSSGAGGGILIDVNLDGKATIESGAVIVSMGGRDINRNVTTNGGTIKIFGPEDTFISPGADIRASRVVQPPSTPEPFSGFFVY